MIVVGSAPTKRLDRPVDDPLGHQRRRDFDHRNLLHRSLVADSVHHPSGFHREETSLLDGNTRFGNAFERYGLLSDGFAKSHPRGGAAAHSFQATLGKSDEPHTVMDSSGTESSLGDLEAATVTEQDVLQRDADVFE